MSNIDDYVAIEIKPARSYTLILEGPDAFQALKELLANVQYDNLNVTVLIVDNEEAVN